MVKEISLLLGALLAAGLPVSAQAPASDETFTKTVAPFVQKNCALCHNEKLKTGGLNLAAYADAGSVRKARDVWENVAARLRAGEMPPKGLPRPKADDISAVTAWIDSIFAESDRTAKPDPGHLTAHRLNRAEYNNTVRDLLAVNFKPAADFPADDSGYGFDNIGDVLSVSPVLMDKYLAAAEKIARVAIPMDPLPKPTRSRFSPERDPTMPRLVLEEKHRFPAEGDYEVRASVGGREQAMHIVIELDGAPIHSSDVLIQKDKARAYEERVHVPYGEHTLKVVLTSREPSAEDLKVQAELAADEEMEIEKLREKHPELLESHKKQRELENPPAYVDAMEIRGPFDPLPPPLPESYRRVFVCGHEPGHHVPACVRQDIEHLARLAYRRPVTSQEVDRLSRFVTMAQNEGLNLEQGMRLAVEAMLVSPNFLFRIERDRGTDVHPISDVELASRLSYFLWSSMPDDGLLAKAEKDQLHEPAVLSAEIRRMLKDSKSDALVDNFAGQWLELRNLDSAHPDPEMFPEFDAGMRASMRTETHMFFDSIVREDRSILDFINGNYTFVNGRLAKFYGIPGVQGDQFRRVSLDGTERSGVLTQASVLLITSYPTRTSPVLRGKWILENILNAPPPPPPPGVGSLDTKGGPLSGTMRQQMEKHRTNPACASCHVRMDPMGFALENYNAVGQWRTHEGALPIDAAGVLPNGRRFNGPAELKALLLNDKNAFAECLTEKMLTYALGRGLERYDRPAVKTIADRVESNGYHFSSLIDGIVNSLPFRMGRADEGRTE